MAEPLGTLAGLLRPAERAVSSGDRNLCGDASAAITAAAAAPCVAMGMGSVE
jgi:hypothetical protein